MTTRDGIQIALLLATAVGCGSAERVHRAEPRPAASPIVTSASPSSDPITPVAPPTEEIAPPPRPGFITAEECIARGDRVTAGGACVRDYPLEGNACRDGAECAEGRCFCTGALGAPNADRQPHLMAKDNTPAAGACSVRSLIPGAWFCLVVKGRARLQGIIVD